MTTVATLLARKQQLLEALQDDPGPNERVELERQLAQVNEALNVLDRAGPTEPANEE
jgi:C4-dicarboxylate-specific signal transduction histidine kinase